MRPLVSPAVDGVAPELSIVIPSRDGAARLPETLAAIAAQEFTGGAEVVVVDDGSADGTREVASGFGLPAGPPRVVRHPRPRGRAAACNTGIEAASGSVVVILDDDMTLRPGALEAHAAFHRSGRPSAVRGRVVLAPPERDTCFARFLAREAENEERALLREAEDLPFRLCLTGHFSAPRAALAAAGGFDASITRYGFEDVELGYRLRERGLRIAYLPGAESIHRAYMIRLDRYLERHREAGQVARHLADRYPDGAFREYLRVEPPRTLGVGRDPIGLVGLRLANRLLLLGPARRALGSRALFPLFRGAVTLAGALRLDRVAHFGYHVLRDTCYYQGYFEP